MICSRGTQEVSFICRNAQYVHSNRYNKIYTGIYILSYFFQKFQYSPPL